MTKAPKSLQNWFVLHFVLDIIFAIPLIFVPEIILPMFGWEYVDPITTRLVGAALFAIGTESLLSRKSDLSAFKELLNLKILWASAAIVGISLGLYMGAPVAAWAFLGVFIAFLFVWGYYRVKYFKI